MTLLVSKTKLIFPSNSSVGRRIKVAKLVYHVSNFSFGIVLNLLFKSSSVDQIHID